MYRLCTCEFVSLVNTVTYIVLSSQFCLTLSSANISQQMDCYAPFIMSTNGAQQNIGKNYFERKIKKKYL